MRTAILFVVCSSAIDRAHDELPELGDVSARRSRCSRSDSSANRSCGRSGEPQYLDDTEVADFVNALGYRLVANAPNVEQQFEFFVIKDNTVNSVRVARRVSSACTRLDHDCPKRIRARRGALSRIGHVTQRHIARLFTQQKQAGIASMAALALAILAARSSPDLAQAAVAGAQYAMFQTALNFTRDNEREADRVGVQILEKSGYDPHAMPAFLERLQRSYRLYETNAPSYARSHPLTYERIADVQNRVQEIPYRQVPDSLQFQLVRARLHARDLSPRDGVAYFEDLLAEKKSRHRHTCALWSGDVALARERYSPRKRRDANVAGGRSRQPDGRRVEWTYEERIWRYPRRAGLLCGGDEALSAQSCADLRLRAAADRQQTGRRRIATDYSRIGQRQLGSPAVHAAGGSLRRDRAEDCSSIARRLKPTP
jgi:predicted Zn-dependent protease